MEQARDPHLGNLSARRLPATGTNQNLDFQASVWRLAAESSDRFDDDTEWPNTYRKCRGYVPHLEEVYSNLRPKLGRMPGDKMEDLDVNSLTGTNVLGKGQLC